jgi:hypothetical protein
VKNVLKSYSFLDKGYQGFHTIKNKNQSIDNIKKKHFYNGLSSSFNYNKETYNVNPIFSSDEKDIIKKLFNDEEKYQNFITKINILEKSSIIKEKEMDMKIKIFNNKLNDKEIEIIELVNELKEKDNTIIALNAHNRELKKTSYELINRINVLTKSLNESNQKYESFEKKYKEIKNSIFSIDGIIEAKSKEGNIIPITLENQSTVNNAEKTLNSKNDNISIQDNSEEENNKNSNDDNMSENISSNK